MSNNSEYVIYTKWVAVKLRKMGFRILRTDVNPNKPEFDCYIFEKTEEFTKALSLITKGGKCNG